MKLAIAVFVKTPGVSPLKTRLAATIGQEKAEHFFQLSLKCIAGTLKNVNITPHWAIAEEESLGHPLWAEFNRLHTGEGDLGNRQSNVYHELLEAYDAVILIGADAPQLSKETIERAILSLQTNDYCIGPASDGGYYLLGGRKKISNKVWSTTPWSDPKTREVLVSQLDSKPNELETLTDVDTEFDLTQILEEMPESMNEEQLALKQWINQL